MKKLPFLGLLLITLSILLIFIGIRPEKHEGFDVMVINNTQQEVKGVTITYLHNKKEVKINTLLPGRTNKVYLNPKERYGDSRMWLYYFDKVGKRHEESVIDYFQTGEAGNIRIEIVSIDNNGKMRFKISNDIYWT